MGWQEGEGREIDSASLEHKPHGGPAGKEAEVDWVDSERANRGYDSKDNADKPTEA